MTLETEAILDRRRLRRHLSFWRIGAILAGVAAVGAILLAAGGQSLTERRQIARITFDGIITDNRDQLKLLNKVADEDRVEAVILFINSPGGTTTGGEAMFEGIRRVAAKKPVAAQFGTVATSAAYILGLATDQIVARGNTITGSVGVIFQWAEVSELLDKLGVKMNEIKSGPLKANPSPFKPVDDEGRRVAQQMVAESMQWFVGLVASRRGIDPSQVPGLAEGRVFSGREALNHKLIDQIGGEVEVQKWLEETRGVTKDLKIVDWKPKRDGDWGVLGVLGRTIVQLMGFGPGGMLDWATDDSRLAALRLDGLVSVWQPSEK